MSETDLSTDVSIMRKPSWRMPPEILVTDGSVCCMGEATREGVSRNYYSRLAGVSSREAFLFWIDARGENRDRGNVIHSR